ncbi:MAG: hypothetical protein ACRD0G_08670 [Acidimicrobiales bacterium]
MAGGSKDGSSFEEVASRSRWVRVMGLVLALLLALPFIIAGVTYLGRFAGWWG